LTRAKKKEKVSQVMPDQLTLYLGHFKVAPDKQNGGRRKKKKKKKENEGESE
jgi:hypothetical protein